MAMMRSALTSVVQIVTALARLAGYSYAVLQIGSGGHAGSSLLLVVGYLPFLAFIDILIQAYSRATYKHGVGIPAFIDRHRRVFAVSCLAPIIAGICYGLNRSPELAVAVLVGTYVAGGVSQLWERWSSQGYRPLGLSLLELSILAGAVLTYRISDGAALILLACLLSFPLARLLTLLGPGGPPIQVPGTIATNTGVGGYIAFSLAQQIAGALSASLPSVFSQLTGDYSGLARNLVVFRLVHSAAAAGSLVINAMGSRLFYGAAGKGFYEFERRFVANSGHVTALVILMALGVCLAAQIMPGNIIPASVLLVGILVAINFESSLLMNCGLPRYTFYCQLLVLIVSIGLLLLITQNIRASQFLFLLIALSFSPVNKIIFSQHLEGINRRTPCPTHSEISFARPTDR